MKKKVLLTAALLACICTVTAFADDDITVKLNGTDLYCDQPPIIIDGSTLVPIRAISEGMGYDVAWDSNDQSIEITDPAHSDKSGIKFFIGSAKAVTEDGEKPISVAPVIINGRTMVPVRVIAESFGCGVAWNGYNRTVYIASVGVPYTYSELLDCRIDCGCIIYACNCNEFISLRDQPSVSGNVITEIPLYSGMTFLTDAGNGFFAVGYHDKFGYVNADYIDYLEPEDYIKKAKVINCNQSITLRTAPDTSAREITQIPLGEEVVITPRVRNDFRLVKYGYYNGWVLDHYLEK